MKTLIYAPPHTDDEIDLRRFVGKDEDVPYWERFKSPYVLFVPGYNQAPPELRGAGRLSVDVTNEKAEELETHPVWRFVSREVSDELTRRAMRNAADQLGPRWSGFAAVAGADLPDNPPAGPEVAPTAPAEIGADNGATLTQAEEGAQTKTSPARTRNSGASQTSEGQ